MRGYGPATHFSPTFEGAPAFFSVGPVSKRNAGKQIMVGCLLHQFYTLCIIQLDLGDLLESKLSKDILKFCVHNKYSSSVQGVAGKRLCCGSGVGHQL